VTYEMTVNYARPVPLLQTLRMEAREVKVEGRRRFRSAEILNEQGEVLVRGQGVFVTIDPEKIFAKNR